MTKAAGDQAGMRMVQSLKTALNSGFTNVVRVRSAHVHKYRFRDEELSNLDLALLFTRTSSKKPPMLRAARRARYTAALIKWRKQMRDNNKNILNACVLLFEEMISILVRNEPPRGVT